MEGWGKRMDKLLLLGYFIIDLSLPYHDIPARRLYRLAPTVGTVDNNMSTNKKNL